MKDTPKLTLSAEELQLVANSNWILTKRKIIDKAAELLGEHAAFAQRHLQTVNLPELVKNTSPKIAKGENYLELPWLMLDYPRFFDKENAFAVRTMFWWGNFFSSTLHLSGSYKKQLEKRLTVNTGLIQQQGFFICINKDEWQHHFAEDNYLPASSLTKEALMEILEKKQFVKIACKFPLQEWNSMPTLLQQSFKNLMRLIAD